jgi:CIC family chloride channel protein
LLVLGAMLGLAVGQVAALVFPHAGIVPGAFAVVGMAAYFTAIVRAPLTGIVLIVEMTSSYAQMLPLLVACFAAYVTAEAFGDLPIYEALLQRDLLSQGADVTFDEPIVLELEVSPGAPFEGHQVRDLGLPAGVVLVSCREGDREWVPTADTELHAHVRVTAVVAPDVPEGLEEFRRGCAA